MTNDHEHDAPGLPEDQGPGLETTRATPLSDDPSLVAGRYRVLSVLGRGGGGTVWLARDEHLGRDVALKRVAGEADNEVLVARGLREARTSAALAHDHVVRVFDAFEHEGSPWIVMEYVAGRSLAQILEGGRSLPVQQVATIGAQMAGALAAAHGIGILHRDVKPANVLLDEAGTHAKLTDFGIARGEEDHQLTRTGMVSGTAAFFSPELAQGQDPTQASDVWALGATLYAAVEGRRPFPDAANAVAQLHTIVREEPQEPRRAGPLTPVLAGMLHGDPERRWSAARAAQALADVAEGKGADVRPRTAPGAGAAAGAGAGAAAAAAAGGVGASTGAPVTRAHRPVDDTRRVPVAGPAPAGPRRGQQAAPYRREPAAAYPSAPRRGSVLPWLIALPLIALLGWLVWAIIGQQGLLDGGPGSDDSASSDVALTPITEAEGKQLASDFYLGIVRGGPSAVAPMLGPDAELASDIGDDLTYVEWANVTVEPGRGATATLDTDVTYTYGDTVYEQHETLQLERQQPGAAPIIVERSTTEPTITRPDEQQGDDADDDSGEDGSGGGDSGENGSDSQGDDADQTDGGR
ncbi:serine/threonine-protein kinase [Ornithinimicrobium panacihumi]|uniref:serine/threonine-protein kinase n=1 Tax=Ornithinimicrobium panacihumi TaxID=2008449 RepID=UPI003F88DB55